MFTHRNAYSASQIKQSHLFSLKNNMHQFTKSHPGRYSSVSIVDLYANLFVHLNIKTGKELYGSMIGKIIFAWLKI